MATITGTDASETLGGTRFEDEINGMGGNDTIRGRGGPDEIDGGEGDDFLIGRTGNDHYFVDSTLDRAVELAGEGDFDTVFATISYILRNNIEDLELRGGAVRGIGNDLDNRIVVGSNQVIDNVLIGGSGADYMSGGRGRDVYHVDNAGDVIDETGEDDFDNVRSTITLDLSDFDENSIATWVEGLTLLGSSDIDGTGGISKNRLVGNSGDNELRGMGGSDVLKGMDGDDSLHGGLTDGDRMVGGAGNDGFYFDFVFFGIKFRDFIEDFTTADDTIHLDRSAYTEVAAGQLAESAFALGSEAQDEDDRILYDSDTGLLRYDPDGSGEHQSAVFAVLAPGTEVNASDFVGYGG